MGLVDEPTSGAPVAVYHRAASGAPVGADPMALIERSAVGAVSLRAPGYRPVVPPPAPGSAKRAVARGQTALVAGVAFVVALAVVGAVLAGILWR